MMLQAAGRVVVALRYWAVLAQLNQPSFNDEPKFREQITKHQSHNDNSCVRYWRSKPLGKVSPPIHGTLQEQ